MGTREPSRAGSPCRRTLARLQAGVHLYGHHCSRRAMAVRLESASTVARRERFEVCRPFGPPQGIMTRPRARVRVPVADGPVTRRLLGTNYPFVSLIESVSWRPAEII